VKGEGLIALSWLGSELCRLIPVKVSQEAKPSPHHVARPPSPGLNDLLRKLGNPPFHRMNGSLRSMSGAGRLHGFISPLQNPSACGTCGAAADPGRGGGRLTDLNGQRLDFRSPQSVLTQGIIASNGMTHRLPADKLKDRS